MADVLLALQFPRQPGNADLPLGRTLIPGSDLQADILLDVPRLDANIGGIFEADGETVLPLPSIDQDVRYDVNVWRGTVKAVSAPHEDGRDLDALYRAVSPAPTFLRTLCRAPWADAAALDGILRAPWAGVSPQRSLARLPWGDLDALAAAPRLPFAYPLTRRDLRRAPWRDADAMRRDIAQLYFDPPPLEDWAAFGWTNAGRRVINRRLPWHGRPVRRKAEWRLRWEDGRPVVSLWPRPDRWEPPPPPPRVVSPDLHLVCPVTPDAPTLLALGRICGAGAPVVIPIRRVYLVIHDLELVRLPDETPIACSELTLDLDADAWAWGFRATLHGRAALDAIQPDQSGEPVMLEARIDGHAWRVLAEEWSENREFGRRAISVSGRGLSARLSAPWHLPADGVTASAMTIRQIIEAHLPTGSGWTIDWISGTPDWLVPAGAWRWQGKTPIQAIHEAATQHGLVVRPAKAGQTLAILPRYPVLPWAYDQASPQLVIPEAAILAVERAKSIEAQANAVYVHGDTGAGILARVKRQYSAADRLAQTVSAPLITHADAARLLGGRILAGQHTQPAVKRLTLPLGGPFPIANIGDLIHINLDGGSVRGICNAVSVAARLADKSVSVRQTINLGEETPNVWAKFRTLLPEPPLLWGSILSTHDDQTVTVVLADGGLMRVRGTGTVGQKVWLRDGAIEGAAPDFGAMIDLDV